VSVNESVTQTSWTHYRSQFFTDLHQTCRQGIESQEIWSPLISPSAKTKVELTIGQTSNHDLDDLVQGHQKYTSDISITVTDTTMRYIGSWIRNQPLAIHWYHELWPWVTLDRPWYRAHDFYMKYLNTMYLHIRQAYLSPSCLDPYLLTYLLTYWIGLQHWADTRLLERISCYQKII